MGADVELMELGIGMVGREGVEDRSGTAGACDVSDNDLRISQLQAWSPYGRFQ